ncbi:hypothetical protein F2Q70_00028849 [Brassica cretica]|uniref:Uncharacterized protein n=1 Tax=Brassica cretica TaxID=69181 RepID=A0A8S9LAH9_BRACR|nr:hypothetical protein F2Q70_00028849 [Brassica cretica]KAF3578840.1 hypothetical protein DY000_02036000 [Brassica cretica]
MPMLNAKAESYQPVSIRVREAVLNEHAPRFEPVNRSGREVMPSEHSAPLQPVNSDEHSLFLTFSNGFPLTEMQIFDFFNWRYGPEVEGVIIPRPRGGRGPPLHGRVVFKNPLIPRMVMRDREKVCFSIDGRPVYAKRFFSKKAQTVASASTSLRDGGSHPGGDE